MLSISKYIQSLEKLTLFTRLALPETPE